MHHLKKDLSQQQFKLQTHLNSMKEEAEIARSGRMAAKLEFDRFRDQLHQNDNWQKVYVNDFNAAFTKPLVDEKLKQQTRKLEDHMMRDNWNQIIDATRPSYRQQAQSILNDLKPTDTNKGKALRSAAATILNKRSDYNSVPAKPKSKGNIMVNLDNSLITETKRIPMHTKNIFEPNFTSVPVADLDKSGLQPDKTYFDQADQMLAEIDQLNALGEQKDEVEAHRTMAKIKTTVQL